MVGGSPSEYVIACYERGIRSPAFREGLVAHPLDGVLSAFVRSGRAGAALADAYSRVLSPAGELRRKLVLLLSILESVSPSDQALEPQRGGPLMTVLGLVLAGLGFSFRLALSSLIIGPVHFLAAMRAQNASAPVK
jgi:hypothetical protein